MVWLRRAHYSRPGSHSGSLLGACDLVPGRASPRPTHVHTTAGDQFHRQARLGQIAEAWHPAQRFGRRRHLPAPRLPRHHRHAADGGRGQGVPRRQAGGQASQADRHAAGSAGICGLLGDALVGSFSVSIGTPLLRGGRGHDSLAPPAVRGESALQRLVRDILTARGSVSEEGPASLYKAFPRPKT